MADTVVAASLTLNSDQANQSVKSFREEMKKAQQEVISTTEKFGATSKEAINAAKRAAELKDRIGDAKKLVDSFNPDEKFRGFTQVLTGVAGGFSAITGAMGLLGVQSEDVQKQILKVQSALAITQGLNSIGDSIQSFKNLGATLVQTLGKSGLIGIAIAGVAALGAAFLGLFDGAKKATEAEKALAESTKDYAKATAGAIEEVNKVKVAFDLARSGVISKEAALKTYNETLGDSLGKTNNLATAEKNLNDKAEDYIRVTGLKAQANALFAKSAQIMADTLVAERETEKQLIEIEGKAGPILEDATKKLRAQRDAAIIASKQQADEINQLGADLLRQAETISQASGIISKTQQHVNADNAKASADAAAKLKEQAAKDLAQAKADFEQAQKTAIFGITGAVTVDPSQAGKSPEQIQFEEEAKARHDLREQEKIDLEQQKAFRAGLTQFELDQSEQRIAAAEAEATAKIGFANAIGSVLDGIAALFGRQTAASKIAALASIAIGTGVAFIQGLDIAQKSAKGTGPAAAFAFPIFYATQIAAILGAVSKAKAALAGAPGGVSTGSLSISGIGSNQAPLTPQPQVSTTQLDQNTLNATGNAAVRAYVVEADETDAHSRIVRLNRAARLGG